MSALLLSWCNSFGLSREAVDLESDFSNGALFCDLLVRHNQLEAGVGVRDTSRADDAARNFSLALPAVHRLGIRLTSRDVQDVIHAKPGAASKLLYSLYSKLAMLERTRVGKESSETPKPLMQMQVCVLARRRTVSAHP